MMDNHNPKPIITGECEGKETGEPLLVTAVLHQMYDEHYIRVVMRSEVFSKAAWNRARGWIESGGRFRAHLGYSFDRDAKHLPKWQTGDCQSVEAGPPEKAPPVALMCMISGCYMFSGGQERERCAKACRLL